MLPYALFGLVILAMGSLGEQFVGVGQPDFSGEYLGASGTNMVGDLATAGAGISVDGAKRAQIAALQGRTELDRTLLDQNRLFRKRVEPHYRGYLEIDGEENWTRRREAILFARAEAGMASDPEAVAEARLRVADEREPLTDLAEGDAPRATIILVALAVIEALEQTAGFGPPCGWDGLKAGAGQFTAAGELLGSAVAGAGWQGAASSGYGGRNADLQYRADALAELDVQLAQLIKAQADAVMYVRWGFGTLKSLLFVAYLYELWTEIQPDSKTYASITAKVGIGVGITMIGFLVGWSEYNAGRAKKVADQYPSLERWS